MNPPFLAQTVAAGLRAGLTAEEGAHLPYAFVLQVIHARGVLDGLEFRKPEPGTGPVTREEFEQIKARKWHSEQR